MLVLLWIHLKVLNFDREEIGSDDRCEYDGDGHAYDDGDGHDNRRHDIDDSPHQLNLKVFRVFLQEMIESQERTRTEKETSAMCLFRLPYYRRIAHKSVLTPFL